MAEIYNSTTIMIDTVEFVIHNLDRHTHLTEFLHRKLSGEGVSKELVEKPDISPVMKMKGVTMFHETGNQIETAYWNKIPSYNYEIAYKIDILRDRIEFNLSIPKYMYATNVFMFLPKFNTPEYQSIIRKTVKQQFLTIYPYFRKFFQFFVNKSLSGVFVDPTLIEIKRLDLCYNFVFDTQAEAETYINYLKRARKRYFRKTGKNTQYESAIYFPQKNTTFKVYHKLPEFLKHDYRKLRKHFEEQNKPFYNER